MIPIALSVAAAAAATWGNVEAASFLLGAAIGATVFYVFRRIVLERKQDV